MNILGEVKLHWVSTTMEKYVLNTPELIAKYARDLYHEDEIEVREQFFAIYLDHQLNVKCWELISIGGITMTITDIRLLILPALKTLSTRVALVHNHPSGNINPSTTDIELTKKVKEALKIFDMDLLDHIIITKDSYYSLGQNNKL